MTVILQNDLSDLFAGHEKLLRGESGGKRLDMSLQTGHELDFSHRDLTGAEFVGAFLNHSDFERSVLRQTNFFGATLSNSNFIESDLSKADMRGAQMQGVNFTNAVMNDANLADGSLLRQGQSGEINPVHNIDAKRRLYEAVFKNAQAQRAKFSSAITLSTDLSLVNFKGAKLMGVNFTNSNLHGATFENADLRGCNFTNANMNAVILLHANLDGATFEGADLTASVVHFEEVDKSAFSHAKMTKSVDSLAYSIKEIIANHRIWVNTMGAEGIRADLEGLDLSHVMLNGVQFQAASLKRALLVGASFNNAVFTMADLSACNAREAQFLKSDCRGTGFSLSCLEQADFQYADCSPMIITSHMNPKRWPTNFAGANLQQANFHGANLEGAHFDNASLARADLREANLRGAFLLDANLTGADLRGANLENADLRGAVGVK